MTGDRAAVGDAPRETRDVFDNDALLRRGRDRAAVADTSEKLET
jgi:hypothetical protein